MSLKLKVQPEGTLRGTADEWIAESMPRAVRAVELARDQVHSGMDMLLRRRGRGPAPPNQPPHEDTGGLRRAAARKRKVRRSKTRVTATISIRHKGANALEFGVTRGKFRRPAHPFVRPVFERLRHVIDRAFAEV